jgi:hypothetical protein
MKSKLLLAAALLFTIGSLQAQIWGSGIKGEGPIVKKTIQLSEFNGFSLQTSGNVILQKGPQSVVVESHQNIIDNIETDVDNKVWKIKFDKNVRGYKELNIYITIPELTRAYISGSGDIVSQDKFSSRGEVQVGISGSGDIKLDIDADKIMSKISGSGDIALRGKANTLEVRISGSGDVKGYDLEVDNCEISISGSGDVQIHANEELMVRTSGSGDVFYTGRPRVNSRTSGSGNVMSKGPRN